MSSESRNFNQIRSIANPDDIPQEIRDIPQWVVWRYVSPKAGSRKPGKMPVSPRSGKHAAVNDRSTWATFEEALEYYYTHESVSGLWFVLTSNLGYIGGDLDHCIPEGEEDANPGALEFARKFDTYTEISPSGEGLRFIVKGELPGGRAVTSTKMSEEFNLELYSQGRFLSFTGNHYPSFPLTISPISPAAVLNLLPAKHRNSNARPIDVPEPEADDNGNYVYASGERNIAMTSMAGRLRQSGGSEEEILEFLRLHNKRMCWPPLDDDEVSRIAASVARYKPGRVSTRYVKRDMALEEAGYQIGRDGLAPYTATNIHIYLRALREDEGYASVPMAYNELSRRIEWDGGNMYDECYLNLMRRIEQSGVFPTTKAPIGLIMSTADELARREWSFNPIRRWLDGLEWDGNPRINAVAADMLGDPSTTAEEAIRLLFLQAVRRIYEPGCQADYVPVIVGSQGLGKTQFINTLVPDKKYAGELARKLDSKDAILSCLGPWLIEISELAAMRASEIEDVKAFLTRQIDEFRRPYGRHNIVEPRTCVFVGTTNEREFLRDMTGNRRFIPIKMTARLDRQQLMKDRDQLWAEAVHRMRQGETTMIREEAMQAIAEAQEAHLEVDAWEPKIADYFNTHGPRDWITTHEVGEEILGVEIANNDRGKQRRIGAAMRRLGYERALRSVDGRVRRAWRPRRD